MYSSCRMTSAHLRVFWVRSSRSKKYRRNLWEPRPLSAQRVYGYQRASARQFEQEWRYETT